MKKILFLILKIFSKLVLKKYKPKIIGVTGSVGKTTTKSAIDYILREKFKIRSSQDSFNNQIGLPLTILGLENSKSIFVWIKNILKAKRLIFFRDKDYPKILVLEMGADRIGDIAYLNTIAPADIALLTEVAPVHVEWFGSLENIYKEKMDIFKGKKDQVCIINADSEYLSKKSLNFGEKKVLTYGIKSNSDVKVSNLKTKGIEGIEFTLCYKNEEEKIELPNIISVHSIYSVLGGVCVGLVMDMKLNEIKERLRTLRLDKGRMSLIKGRKDTWIIDDSYNSSPLACRKALETFSEFRTNNRRIVVLGDMLELGEISEQEHKDIGKYIAELGNIEILITCGYEAKNINVGAMENGFNEKKLFNFENSEIAKEFIKKEIMQGDVILVKGSQGSRMEKIVKEIILESEKAKELLVRQTGIWEKK